MRRTLAALVTSAVITGCTQQAEIREVCPPVFLSQEEPKYMSHVVATISGEEGLEDHILNYSGKGIGEVYLFNNKPFSFEAREDSGSFYEGNITDNGVEYNAPIALKRSADGCWRQEE